HSPDTIRFILGVVEVSSVAGLGRGDSACFGDLNRMSLSGRYLPNLKWARPAPGGEVQPLTIARPTGGKVIGARIGREEPCNLRFNVEQIDLSTFARMKLKSNEPRVG